MKYLQKSLYITAETFIFELRMLNAKEKMNSFDSRI